MTTINTMQSRLRSMRSILVFVLVAPAMGQIPVSLTIDGLSAVPEDSDADYIATALFDNGQSFEVTLQSNWSVDPDTSASVDQFGRLTTGMVFKDQLIVLSASFTSGDVTVDDALDVTIIDVPTDDGVDPWPFWGRTTTRIARTSTMGPRTPRIDWSLLISDFPSEVILEASPVMDAHGRIFVGTADGMTGVDTSTQEILWMETDGDIPRGAAIWDGRVVWGDVPPFAKLYCHGAELGEELWTFQSPIGFHNEVPVIDPNGVVYNPDAFGTMYARLMEDGSEVWTEQVGGLVIDAPSLDWPLLLTSAGGPGGRRLKGLDPFTHEEIWSFPTEREIYGTPVIYDGHVYVGSQDRYLYSIDAETGEEEWRFWCEQLNRGTVAVGHDGTIYTATAGNEGILFAVSPEGKEIWRFNAMGNIFNAPIVGGDGTIYFCSQWPPFFGWVQAVRTDGTELWTMPMKQQVTASPMLAPDGTLYVSSRDNKLYAFRDPVGDLDFDGDIDLTYFAQFNDCLTGPRLWGEAAKTTPGCELLDFDRDWDVDLTDMGLFQQAFTVP